MDVRFEDGNDGRLLLNGEMTIYFAAEIKPQLVDACHTHTQLQVDLAGVREFDAAGLQLLALMKQEAAAREHQVTFTHHSPPIMEVLQLCGMESIFDMLPATNSTSYQPNK